MIVGWLKDRVFSGVDVAGPSVAFVSGVEVLGAFVGVLDGEASAVVESREDDVKEEEDVEAVSVDEPPALYIRLACAWPALEFVTLTRFPTTRLLGCSGSAKAGELRQGLPGR